MKFIRMGAFLFVVLILASCGSNGSGSDDPVDVDKPTVTITKPAEGDALGYGQSLLVSGTFADDMALKEVTFNLSGTAKDAWAPADVTIKITSGKTFSLTDKDIFEEVIPEGKMGDYILTTTVKDASDKVVTSTVNFTIVPVEVAAPEMTITKPAANAQITRGGELFLSGTFTDDKALAKIVATLAPPSDVSGGVNLKGLKVLPEPWKPAAFEVELSGMSQELTDKQLFDTVIPADCKTGKYILTLTLHDASGKMTVKSIAIEFM